MAGITKAQQTRLAKLDAFDLSPVTQAVARASSAERAQKLEAEFRRFAALWILAPKTKLAPPHAVDKYWHELIVDTRTYARFCKTVVGRFVDHVPSAEPALAQPSSASPTAKRRASAPMRFVSRTIAVSLFAAGPRTERRSEAT